MKEQIIEIFGTKVKIVKDKGEPAGCKECAFDSLCTFITVGNICEDSNRKFNRHFVEVDEDGNEIT